MDTNGVSASTQGKPIETVLTDQIKNNRIRARKNGHHAHGPKKAHGPADRSNVGMQDIYKSLTVLADNILSKLDEILKEDLPDGIASLKPEDHTPEATAQRIVDGTTALFAVYAKQNPEMEGEELIDSFMETIRGGIKQGYNEAAAILGDIGAFDIDGVQSGIEKTMLLVEEKLQAFESNLRKELGVSEEPDVVQAEESETAQTEKFVPKQEIQTPHISTALAA